MVSTSWAGLNKANRVGFAKISLSDLFNVRMSPGFSCHFLFCIVSAARCISAGTGNGNGCQPIGHGRRR